MDKYDPRKRTMKPGEEADLEEKFQEYLRNKYSNKQHPMYQTASTAIGTVPKGYTDGGKKEMRTLDQAFTKSFTGGNYRDNSLQTGVVRSRVHKAFDGLL